MAEQIMLYGQSCPTNGRRHLIPRKVLLPLFQKAGTRKDVTDETYIGGIENAKNTGEDDCSENEDGDGASDNIVKVL